MKKKNTEVIIAAACLAGISAAALDMRLCEKKYRIRSPKIRYPVKLAQISDLHSCRYGKNELTLIKKIAKFSPDAVMLTGDIFDEELPFKNSLSFLKNISMRYPCFFVMGNHELKTGRVPEIRETLKAMGITLLEDDGVSTVLNGNDIDICGVSDPHTKKYLGETVSFEDRLMFCDKKVNRAHFSVLLSHRPERAKLYGESNFDLVLSGHAHGGQWRIPGILNGLFAPNQGLFPKFAGGLYPLSSGHMIVSRGLARESTPVPRIFNRPELVLIELVSDSI